MRDKMIISPILAFIVGSNFVIPVNANNLVSPSIDKYYFKMCTDIAKLDEKDCACIISVSDYLVDNDNILEMYLNASNRMRIAELYKKVIDGDSYNDLNFSSRQEKEEYVQGKGILFSRRVEVECLNK